MFKIKHLHVWLNDVFLPSLRDGKEECDAGPVVLSAQEGDADLVFERTPGGKWKVSRSTALAWAHKLGLSFVANRKSHSCDNHDRKDVLKYRKRYLDSEFELELRQLMWCQMAPAEFDKLNMSSDRESLTKLGLYYRLDENTAEIHVDLLPVAGR
jgi:hypothetical protein